MHENEGDNEIVKRTPAVAMFDGATGEIIWQDGLGQDAGRGVAADIDPRYDGAECWCNIGGLRRGDTGEIICNRKPDSCNFTIIGTPILWRNYWIMFPSVNGIGMRKVRIYY